MTSPNTASKQTLRIVDANLNRTGEGLRLLEDIARLILDNVTLTHELKTMRHELLEGDWPFQLQLLQARDSIGDVGINLEAGGTGKRELYTVAVANSRRAQESLRVLEEMGKIPDTQLKLDPEKFKQARFRLYSIEQELLARLLRRDKTGRISGLYVIIDTQTLKNRSPIEAARQAISGGARVIQLRDKLMSKKELLIAARALRDLCFGNDVLFIMNDYLDLAIAADADGLHLGQEDLPIEVARKLLPLDKILGCSAKTVEQAIAAQSDGADYIAIGSIYPTTSKEKAQVVGLETLRRVRQTVTIPLVAIGGINKDNAGEVTAAGADSIAVIRAVLGAEDMEEASRQIVTKLEAGK